MASTNVTNIKNAFTLSSTLGGNAGNQTSKDPVSKGDPNDPNVLIKLEAKKITFKQLPFQSSEELSKAEFSENSSIQIAIQTIEEKIEADAVIQLFYNTGWYSTSITSSLPPGTNNKTSFDIVDKKNARGNNPPGTSPNDVPIANKLYLWLDDIFLEMGKKMVKQDFENVENIFEFNFASQESALPNSDEEDVGPPPSVSSFGQKIDTTGGLANARFVWIRWFINEYIKNLDRRFQEKNYYTDDNNELQEVIKSFSENIQNNSNKLKVNVNKKIVLPYTPFGSNGLEKGAPKDFDVPLVFQNGTANLALYGTRGENISNRPDFKLPDYIKQNATPGSTPQSLLDQLKERYGKEQRAVIKFVGVIIIDKTIPRCSSTLNSTKNVAPAPDFVNTIPFKISKIPPRLKNTLFLRGKPLRVPDRFGNAARNAALPYFLTDYPMGKYKTETLFVWGFWLRIIDKAFPNSEAFRNIEYVKHINGNTSVYDYFIRNAHPNLKSNPPSNEGNKIWRLLYQDNEENPEYENYNINIPLKGSLYFSKEKQRETSVEELKWVRSNTDRFKIYDVFNNRPDHPYKSIPRILDDATKASKQGNTPLKLSDVNELNPQATNNQLWNEMIYGSQKSKFQDFVVNFLDNKIVDVRVWDETNSIFNPPINDNEGIRSYGVFGSTIYDIFVGCGRKR